MKKMTLILLALIFVLVSVLPAYGASEAFWISENQRLTKMVQELQYHIWWRDQIIERYRRSVDAVIYSNYIPGIYDVTYFTTHFQWDPWEYSVMENSGRSLVSGLVTLSNDFGKPEWLQVATDERVINAYYITHYIP